MLPTDSLSALTNPIYENGENEMPTTATEEPLSDLMYDWLTVLQSKAEAVAAYEQFLEDAESADATDCAQLLKKLHQEESASLREVRDHVFGMIARCHAQK